MTARLGLEETVHGQRVHWGRCMHSSGSQHPSTDALALACCPAFAKEPGTERASFCPSGLATFPPAGKLAQNAGVAPSPRRPHRCGPQVPVWTQPPKVPAQTRPPEVTADTQSSEGPGQMWPPKVLAQTWPPEVTASTYPPPGPGRNMATRVPCMAQKQTQSPAAFQSMAFPRIRQTLHPWVCLSSQEGVDTAAEFSLGVPSADPRGRTGGAHPAAPLRAHSPGHASPRCGVGPGGGRVCGRRRGPGQLPAVREQGEVSGEHGAPRIPHTQPLASGPEQGCGRQAPASAGWWPHLRTGRRQRHRAG